MMECFKPEISREIVIGSQKYRVNDKYYVVDFSSWDEELRDWLARKENISLNNEHMRVIYFLRDRYQRNKKHPVIRSVTSELAKRFGTEKGTVKYFHTLFPKGIHQAFLIAGIPMQDSCC